MLLGIVVIIGLGVLILGHEAGHFFAAKQLKMGVEEFGVGFPPRITAKKKGETEYSLNWLPFGGFVKIAGENDRITSDDGSFENLPAEDKKKLFYFRPAWQRSIVLLAGITMNLLIGWILLSLVFMIGSPHMLVVAKVESNSPAAAAGVIEGDIIEGYTSATDFINFAHANQGKEIDLRIAHETGKTADYKIKLRENPGPNEGALGIELAEAGVNREAPHVAIWSGLKTTWYIIENTVLGFYELLKNIVLTQKVPAGVVGPVGI
ncbi:MAG: site-2 protease family protein, partial [Candidatus Liptonbacteria bacterium]